MPQGLQVWSSSGRLTVDLTDKLARFIGSVDTGLSNGSVSVPQFSGGGGFAMYFPLQGGWIEYMAAVSVTSTGFSWTFPTSGSSNNVPGYIVYGVYL